MSHEQLLEVSAPSPLIVIYVPRPSMKEQDGGCGQLVFSNSNISSVLLLIPIQQISNNVFKEQKYAHITSSSCSGIRPILFVVSPRTSIISDVGTL